MSERNQMSPWQRARIISPNTVDMGRLLWVQPPRAGDAPVTNVVMTNNDPHKPLFYRREWLELLPEFDEWVAMVRLDEWTRQWCAGDPDQRSWLLH